MEKKTGKVIILRRQGMLQKGRNYKVATSVGAYGFSCYERKLKVKPILT